MRIVLHVFGLRAEIISAEFVRFSMSRPRGNCPYLTPQFIREGEQEQQRYIPPSVDQLRLALVSDAEEMGEWGTTAPLLLEKTRPSLSGNGMRNGNDVNDNLLYFTASVQVPASSVKEHTLRFRLVIVDEPLLSAIAAMSTTATSSSGMGLCVAKGIRPGAAIVAVENAYWQPETVTLVPSDSHDGKTWHAYIDLRDRVV
ncbi:phosphoric diester hydrolase, partial [Trypanosoma cruzi]